MRDAFGGAFMIKLFLVFIFIYVCLTAMALNYAKAFKVKNKVIDYIETNEITDITSMSVTARNEMNEYFEKEILGGDLNYRSTNNTVCKTDNNKGSIEYCDNGITIIKYDPKRVGVGSNKLGVYYKVSVEVAWEIPFLNKLLQVSGRNGEVKRGIWVVSGETRTIVRE